MLILKGPKISSKEAGDGPVFQKFVLFTLVVPLGLAENYNK